LSILLWLISPPFLSISGWTLVMRREPSTGKMLLGPPSGVAQASLLWLILLHLLARVTTCLTLARKKMMTVSSSRSTLPLSAPTAYLKSIQRRPSKKQSINYVVIPCMIATNRVPTRGFGLTFTWIGTPLSIDMQRKPWWRPSGLTRIGWPLDVTPSSTK
jgi:hypothetical protein